MDSYSVGDSDAPDPDTWLWISIFSTACCCLPLGVVGIVFAAMAKGAYGSGDYATADRHARTARGWATAAI
ncbi:MAG: CD225/dispanin family protein, partial [Micromonosporaceae bacterium]